jgi:protein-S-isoprenylcysteine O-methyltransferase Ste14
MASFAERGGWWLVAQLPLMILQFALPPWLGTLSTGAPRWVAIGLVTAGMAVGIAARLALGASFTAFPRPVEHGAHVARGPYRFVRHPIYVSVFVTGLGWALLWQSAAGAALTLALAILLDLKSRREERWLEAAYPSYTAYRRRVARFIPGLY